MQDDRTLYVGSRDFILYRSWVTELWMRVIQKAIDDLALFTRMREDGEKLSEEEEILASTAEGFLFNPEYTIDLAGTEITLEDLLEHWECKDMKRWRSVTRDKVEALVEEKRNALQRKKQRL